MLTLSSFVRSFALVPPSLRFEDLLLFLCETSAHGAAFDRLCVHTEKRGKLVVTREQLVEILSERLQKTKDVAYDGKPGSSLSRHRKIKRRSPDLKRHQRRNLLGEALIQDCLADLLFSSLNDHKNRLAVAKSEVSAAREAAHIVQNLQAQVGKDRDKLVAHMDRAPTTKVTMVGNDDNIDSQGYAEAKAELLSSFRGSAGFLALRSGLWGKDSHGHRLPGNAPVIESSSAHDELWRLNTHRAEDLAVARAQAEAWEGQCTGLKRSLAEATEKITSLEEKLVVISEKHGFALRATVDRGRDDLREVEARYGEMLQSASEREKELQRELAAALKGLEDGNDARKILSSRTKELEGKVAMVGVEMTRAQVARREVESTLRAERERHERACERSKSLESENEDLKTRLRSMDLAVEGLQARVHSAEQAAKACTEERDASRAELETLWTELEQRSAELDVRAKAVTKMERKCERVAASVQVCLGACLFVCLCGRM